MSDLLEKAIAAHGGWDRWQQVRRLAVDMAAGGTIFPVKGWPNVYDKARVIVDPHRQTTEFSPFLHEGQRSVYEPQRTAIFSDSGKVLDHRDAPRSAFAGHTVPTKWDSQNLIYFSGYAMWTYLTTPFLFKLPSFQVEEVAPWDENGETWRRLKVVFPPEVASHSREQSFYFGEDGILRRHDYSVEIMGGTASANYATEPKTFGGLVFPTKRRVYAKGPDNRPLLERVAVSIDIHDVEVS